MNILGKWNFTFPIRAQLLALVLLAVLPALLIILKDGLNLKNSKIRETYDESLHAVRTLAMQQEQIADSTKQVLKTLAQVPQVRNAEAKSCRKLFQDLISQNPAYLFISIADPAGKVIASSHPIIHSSIADRKHFQDAIKTENFSVGEYVVSRDINLPSLYYAYPIKDAEGHVRFVLTAALNLNVYDRFLDNKLHAFNHVMGITDHKGVRLYRYPNKESDVTGVGVVVSKTSLKYFAEPAEEGIYEGVGSDGTYRLYAYRKLRLQPNSPVYGYVFFGSSRDAILAGAQHEFYRNLMFLGLTLLLALAAAWVIGNKSIVNRLQKLKEAAHRLANGNLKERAGLPRGNDEISDLADSFDSMSCALEKEENERKWAHEELKKYSDEISDLYNNAPCGYHSLDADGTFLRINDTELNWLGYTREEMIGKKRFSDIMTPESRDYFIENYPLFKSRGWIKDVEYELIRRDGTILPVILNATAIKDGEGNFLQSRASLFDNTERRQIEEERKGMDERLQRAEKMESLGILAGGVAHDLNNVLGILIGYSELIDEEIDQSSHLRPHIKYIRQGGERAAAIVQDLLTLARRGVQAREVINLNTIIADTMSSPEFEKLQSYHPEVRVKTELDADLLNIKGSAVHLGKTMMNLISNAAEAMKAGGLLTITSSNEYLDRPVHGYDTVQEGDYVIMTVSDTGEGISASDMKRIFEPFYTKKVMGRSGTGLGLAVVWGTVKDHNGYIDVESTEGKGTTFTLYFPVTRGDVSSKKASIPVSEYQGKGESVLIVDDVEGQRELARGMLKKLNYAVMAVSSGEEAVEYLRDNKVEIVVLDMIMDPGMDGLDTYRKIVDLHLNQKAIIVSGFSESDRVRQAQELGAGAYVKKPYVLERLGLAVRKELDESRQSDELP